MSPLPYQPSSSEKKSVILIYLLIGVMMILQKDRIERWVWGHFHQALGWRVIFVLLVFVSIILVFIPILRYLPLLLLMIILGIRGRFVYQTRSGLPAQQKGAMALFAGMGKWMTDVMDIHPEIVIEEQEEDIIASEEIA